MTLSPEDAETLAALFAAGRAVSEAELARALGVGEEEAKRRLQRLSALLEDGGLGVWLKRGAKGWRLFIHPRYRETAAKMRPPRPKRLSQAALETLAVVAYHQPVTKAEIDAHRGKDSQSAIETLLELGLIRARGKHPRRYVTTERFLELFGLESLEDLPPLKEGGLPELRD